MIEALRKTGVPENAFGFEGSVQNRLDSEALEKLVAWKAWSGVDNDGMRFIQQISEDGRIAFHNNASLLVGTTWTEDDKFFVKFRTSMLGRKDCGHIYRNPAVTRHEQNEYVRVALGTIYYFTVQ